MQLPIWMPGLGHVNMYGLVDDRGLAVVDPGLPGPQRWKALKQRLTTAGFQLKDVHTVIVTHSHPDHFGGAGRIKQGGGRGADHAQGVHDLVARRAQRRTLSEAEAERLEQEAIDEAAQHTTVARRAADDRRADDDEGDPLPTRSTAETQTPVGAVGRHDAVGRQQAPDAAAQATA